MVYGSRDLKERLLELPHIASAFDVMKPCSPQKSTTAIASNKQEGGLAAIKDKFSNISGSSSSSSGANGPAAVNNNNRMDGGGHNSFKP